MTGRSVEGSRRCLPKAAWPLRPDPAKKSQARQTTSHRETSRVSAVVTGKRHRYARLSPENVTGQRGYRRKTSRVTRLSPENVTKSARLQLERLANNSDVFRAAATKVKPCRVVRDATTRHRGMCADTRTWFTGGLKGHLTRRGRERKAGARYSI